MMDRIQTLKSIVVDLNSLILQGYANWKHADDAMQKLILVIEDLENEKKEKEKAHNEFLENAKKRREQMKAEAAERGEKIVGGETIRINADGTKEVLIP